MEVTFWLLAALAAVGLAAGFIDSIAGGGGLLAVPALLFAGFDPVTALATNKLQGTFGSGSAAWAFARRGHIEPGPARLMIVTTFAGACLGVTAVRIAPVSFLKALLPVLLIAMACYFALSARFSPGAGALDRAPRCSGTVFALTAAPAVGFYDGVFGPGAGSFYMIAFVSLLGFGIVRATAHTKLLNLVSNAAALMIFAMSGKIVWLVGLTMGIGQFIGAQAGSLLAARQGARLIRPLLVTVCCILAVKLLLDLENPLYSAAISLIH